MANNASMININLIATYHTKEAAIRMITIFSFIIKKNSANNRLKFLSIMTDFMQCMKLYLRGTYVFLTTPYVFTKDNTVVLSRPLLAVSWVVHIFINIFYIYRQVSITDMSEVVQNPYILISLLWQITVIAYSIIYDVQLARKHRAILHIFEKLMEIDRQIPTQQKDYKKMYQVIVLKMISSYLFCVMQIISVYPYDIPDIVNRFFFCFSTSVIFITPVSIEIQFLLFVSLIEFYVKKIQNELERINLSSNLGCLSLKVQKIE